MAKKDELDLQNVLKAAKNLINEAPLDKLKHYLEEEEAKPEEEMTVLDSVLSGVKGLVKETDLIDKLEDLLEEETKTKKKTTKKKTTAKKKTTK